MNAQTVVIGLSGGVDSTVSAKILQEQGYNVIGLFMKTWDDQDPQCPAAEDSFDARNGAQKLKIPFYSIDLSKEYSEHVFQYFLEQNKAGRTPNADILCNKYIKFDAFLKKAQSLGTEMIATGHYAKKRWNKITKKWELLIPKDTKKDQTYFLYTLQQYQLEKTIFPLAEITKPEVRKKAEKEGFLNAHKKDSVGICMVGDRNYRKFLQQYIPTKKGSIKDAETRKKIGEHLGLTFYTIGQRKDLGIGGIKGFHEAPWFVIKKDFTTNELMVSQNESLLLSQSLTAEKLHWIAGNPPEENFECEAKIRYRSESVPCTVTIQKKRANVDFKKPVRAIASGQSIVFYDQEVCLGGGEIV